MIYGIDNFIVFVILSWLYSIIMIALMLIADTTDRKTVVFVIGGFHYIAFVIS